MASSNGLLDLRVARKSKTKAQASNEKRCGLYIRASTEEQCESPDWTIKNQEERLRLALRLKNGDTPFGQVVDVYTDPGKSGKDMNRPGLQRMLRDVSEGRLNLIMISDLSRLSRSIKDFSQVWEFMQAHRCGLWSLRENFDTSTAAGEMMLFSVINFAQFERKQTGERVSANFQSRASRGLYNGGQLPLGFEIDPVNRGHLTINEKEAETVRAAFKALIEKGSVSAAAKWLNSNGYSFHGELRGGGCRPRMKEFTITSLAYLLAIPAYIGIRRYKAGAETKEVPANWQPIIDEKTFEIAQTIIREMKKRKPETESRYPFLLTGKVKCSECGAAMVGKSAHGNSGKVPYYEHGWQTVRESVIDPALRKKKCQPYRVQGKILERRVWEELYRILQSPALSEPIFHKLKERGADGSGLREIHSEEIKLSTLTTKAEALVSRLSELPRSVSAAPIYQEIERLEKEKSATEERLRTLKQSKPEQTVITLPSYAKLLNRLAEVFTESPLLETKQKIIQALISHIEIKKEGFRLHFYVGAEQIKKGEASASPSFLLSNFSLSRGSNRLTNGGPTKNRTWNNPLGKDRYIHLTMGPHVERSHIS
jgi:site-specific DNA recombinase